MALTGRDHRQGRFALAKVALLELAMRATPAATMPEGVRTGPIADKAVAHDVSASAQLLDVDPQRVRVQREMARVGQLFEAAAAVDPYLSDSLLSWVAVFDAQPEPPPEVLALARNPLFHGAAALP